MRRIIALTLLTCLLSIAGFSQANPPGDHGLNIEIVSEEGAVNYLKSRTGREVIVRVTDENHKPVAGAAVIFMLPTQGASGTFLNGAKFFTTTTDGEGRAVAAGLRANGVKGPYNLQVRASFNGQTATTSVAQANAVAAASGAAAGATTAVLSIKVITIIAVAAAAGVAGGVVAATQSGGPKPATVTPGTVTFGPPHP